MLWIQYGDFNVFPGDALQLSNKITNSLKLTSVLLRCKKSLVSRLSTELVLHPYMNSLVMHVSTEQYAVIGTQQSSSNVRPILDNL